MNVSECKEIEKKKSFLRRYKKNKAKIKRLEEKIAFLNDRLLNVQGIRISDEPKGHSNITQADLITEKIEYEERIKALKIRGAEIRREITKELDSLSEAREVEVLELFFIDCLDFGQIATKIGYTERHVIRIYGDAIRKLCQ